jgi:AhpD family alkylhydroperoxidase
VSVDYIALRKDLEQGLGQLGRELPGPMSGFARMHRKATADGALTSSVKEMMALAISIVIGCEGCIAYHVHDAIEAGASRDEILETIGVAVLMGGGPASIYATHAMEAVDQFMLLPAEMQ